MRFEDVLDELGKSTGLSDLALDESGSCSLLFDGDIELTFIVDAVDSAIILYGLVGDSVTLREAKTCGSLLVASCLGAETGGAAFALYGNSVILWKRFDGFEDYSALEKAVNAFLPQVAQWRERLGKQHDAPGEVAPAPSNAIRV